MFILSSKALYVDEKRAIPLLRSTGLTIASQRLLWYGSIDKYILYWKSSQDDGHPPMRDILKSTVFTEKETAAAIAKNPSPGADRSTAAISLTNHSIFQNEKKSQGEISSFAEALQKAREKQKSRAIQSEHVFRSALQEVHQALQTAGRAANEPKYLYTISNMNTIILAQQMERQSKDVEMRRQQTGWIRSIRWEMASGRK